MKEITRAQEEIMQVLWKIEEGVVNDILQTLPDPKPAYNTVSTVVRVLEKKGYVGHKAYGKIHVYFPLIKQDEYAKYQFKGLLKNHFGNSMKKMAFTLLYYMAISYGSFSRRAQVGLQRKSFKFFYESNTFV